jgi:indole-3-glycerol phosphate synthase
MAGQPFPNMPVTANAPGRAGASGQPSAGADQTDRDHSAEAAAHRRARPPGAAGKLDRISPVPDSESFLARACADARLAAQRRAERLPLAALKAAAPAVPPRGFRAAVSRPATGEVALIAEVKRRSPSRGALRADLDPGRLAAAYRRGGASAISVLTEPLHFAGSPRDLMAVRAAVDLPLLRKDFLTTAYQVWEARAWGADAVLLIVAALDGEQLADLLGEADAAGLDALVEVHSREEAAAAGKAGAGLVGVNARDLATLTVDLGRFAAVRDALPAGATLVAESGIRTRADVEAAATAGADAVLVGETLVLAADPAATAAALLAASPQPQAGSDALTKDGGDG